MYRSLYFSGGQAIHGSHSDTYVVTYPASHGCVRMLHRDVDWLWRKGGPSEPRSRSTATGERRQPGLTAGGCGSATPAASNTSSNTAT